MRLLLLAIFFICLSTNAQWKIETGGNKFDGEYKAAYVMGNGGKLPFNNPKLVINRFNNGSPNIYLSEIGYTGCGGATLSFAFDGLNDILVFNSTSNKEDDAAFISQSYLNSSMDEIELIELLKSKGRVYIRYESSCTKLDYEFSLAGSTSAINYVTDDYYEQLQIQLQKEADEAIERSIALEEKKVEQRLAREEELKEKQRIKKYENEKNFEVFKQKLIESFNIEDDSIGDQLPKEVYRIQVYKGKKITYCQKIYPSGKVYENKEDFLYPYTKYMLYNQIKDSCVLIKCYTSKGDLYYSYYIDKENLEKFNNSNELRYIIDNWDMLNAN